MGSAILNCILRTRLDLGMLSSMSATGSCDDNAVVESFSEPFKVSSIGNEVFAGEDELKSLVFEYVEPF